MPPFIPRKRRYSNSQDARASKSLKKDSLFDAIDSPGASTTLDEHKLFRDRLNDAEDSSSLSEISNSEIEIGSSNRKVNFSDVSGDEQEDELGWEDAVHADEARHEEQSDDGSGDIVIDLKPDAHAQFISSNPFGKKKAPTKLERQKRIATHCMHVQFLLFHNLIRNAWCCDQEAQSILINQLPPAILKEVTRWKALSGINVEKPPDSLPSSSNGRQRRQTSVMVETKRNHRDWGTHAQKQETGVPDLSRGDPLIRLLKVLAAYWKKRFIITAPSLRKQGYKSLAELDSEVTSFKHDEHDPEKHGERLTGVQQFRDLARSCKGSRDVGAQLFTTLVRGLGIDARLVASLQPVGFGWGRGEEGLAIKKKNRSTLRSLESSDQALREERINLTLSPSTEVMASKESKRKTQGSSRANGACTSVSASDDSDAITTRSRPESGDGDDEPLIDFGSSSSRIKRNMRYDRDILYPTYWTEAISPITSDVFPVDAFLLSPAVATCEEHLAAYEPRGAKAEKAKQVFAYVIGYSSDGTAKDVTTRYLRRHMWPGRTKGIRLPVEKVAVYNRRGKIKYYEDYDWFKSVMSGYMRLGSMRTAVDDLEEAKDLKVPERHKKEQNAGKETLQSYKTSADFVLERHLRREEAILPGSKPVKTFLTGKGENAKEEPVYSRKDVAICRTGESWHKEGRQVKAGEQPIKMVPIRAVTLTRKREVEEAERANGEKLKQGLYALDQTDWIIPPPIQNGVIPKNVFGNMDCYVPTMVPQGAVHIPLKSTSKICKRLNIDFAEACTGFEFGKQRAVPVITGVVVATEHEDRVIAEWEKDEQERKIKEEGKREQAALKMWRKLLMGLKIMQRVQEEYGGDPDKDKKDQMNPFTNKHKIKSSAFNGKEPVIAADEIALGHTDHSSSKPFEDHMNQEIHANTIDSLSGADHRNNIYEKESEFSETEGGGFIIEPEDDSPELHRDPSYLKSEAELGIEHTTVAPNNKRKTKAIKPQPQPQPHQIQTPPKSNKRPRKTKSSGEKTPSVIIINPPLRTTTTLSALPSISSKNLVRAYTPKSQTPNRRNTPKRAAAAQSERAVRSHYFVPGDGKENDSDMAIDDEKNDDDDEEKASSDNDDDNDDNDNGDSDSSLSPPSESEKEGPRRSYKQRAGLRKRR